MICLGVLEVDHQFFSKYWHGARNACEMELDRAGFFRKTFFTPMLEKWSRNEPKIVLFWIYLIVCSLIFTAFVLKWKFILFSVFLHKYHIYGKKSSLDISQNALSQSSDCKIYKSTISQKKKKKKKKKSLILYARWYKFMKMKSWMGKNKFVNGGNLLHADSDAVSFGCTDVLLCIFDF